MLEENNCEERINMQIIIACLILMAAIGVTVFQALGCGGHYLISLLPIIAFFIWFKIIRDSSAPDWLKDISSTLFLLMSGYVSFDFVIYLSNTEVSFGTLLLCGSSIGVGIWVCLTSFYISYKSTSTIGHAISALLCFAFVATLGYCGWRAHWSIWVQVPLLLLIAIGLFYANYVPNCSASFWMLLAHFILCIVSFLYAVFLNSGRYVGECVTIGMLVAPCSYCLFHFAPTVRDISKKDANWAVKILGAGLLSLICIAITLPPFIVMFL